MAKRVTKQPKGLCRICWEMYNRWMNVMENLFLGTKYNDMLTSSPKRRCKHTKFLPGGIYEK